MFIYPIIFQTSLSRYGSAFVNMSLIPASNHRCPLLVCEIIMVGHYHMLIMWVILHVDKILNIFEDDMNEAVVIHMFALWHTREHLGHQTSGFARIVLLHKVNFDLYKDTLTNQVPTIV